LREAALVLLDNVEVAFPLERALESLTPLGLTVLVTARHHLSLANVRLLGAQRDQRTVSTYFRAAINGFVAVTAWS